MEKEIFENTGDTSKTGDNSSAAFRTKVFVALIFLGIGMSFAGVLLQTKEAEVKGEVSYSSCVSDGGTVHKGWIDVCVTSDGVAIINNFTDELASKIKEDVEKTGEDNDGETVRPVMFIPEKGTGVGSEFNIIGAAPGTWFFEANATINVLAEEELVGDGLCTATEWMTEDYVPFTCEVTLEKDKYESGDKLEVKFIKNNPSGLEDNDDNESTYIMAE